MRPIQLVTEHLNQIAIINGEHMRLIGYEKSSNGNFYLFSAPDGSRSNSIARLTDDMYYRYEDYRYIPFISPDRKINRHLALNGAPIVKRPLVLKVKEDLTHEEYLKKLSDKYKGQLIQVTTEDGLIVGKLKEIKKDENEKMGLYIDSINGKEYTVYEPILPFFINDFKLQGNILKSLISDL